jgi:allantoinase
VTPAGARRLHLGVSGGRIVALVGPGERLEAGRTVEAGGLVVLPGLVDTHVHLRDPGFPEREDFDTGTAAAAHGGVTTVLEMPLSIPPVCSGEILARRRAAVEPRARVDFALYGGLGHDNPGEAEGLARAGAVAFKTFRITPAPERAAEFVGLCAVDAGAMAAVLRAAARTGRPAAVHAEADAVVQRETGRLRAAGRRDLGADGEARPELAEAASVAETLALAEAAGARVQIVHVTCPAAARLVRQAKARGVAVTAETCPQSLTFAAEEVAAHGALAKVNPPLRSAESREGLWEFVHDGTIDVVGSDHCPFAPGEKAARGDDVLAALPGLAGIEAMLPLLLTAVHQGRLTLERLAALASERAARIFGLYPAKGAIQVGADADLVLVDPGAHWTLRAADFYTRGRGTAGIFDGREVVGRPVMTLVRGRPVMEDGKVVGEPGTGRRRLAGRLRSASPVDQVDPGGDQGHGRHQRRGHRLPQEETPRRQPEERRPEGEGRHLGGRVPGEEPEPGEVAREGDDHALVAERGQDERGRSGHARLAAGVREAEQQDGRAGELVEERLRGADALAPGLDHQRGRAPQDGAGQLQGVADQLAARGEPEAVGEGQGEPREGAGQPGEPDGVEPLARQEEVGAERDDEGGGVEEQDRPRGGGQGQTPVDADELGGEEERDRHAVAEGAVPTDERDPAEGRPGNQADGRDRRAEARLRERADAGVADLDRDLPEPPDQAEPEQHGHGRDVQPVAARLGDGRLHGAPSYRAPRNVVRDHGLPPRPPRPAAASDTAGAGGGRHPRGAAARDDGRKAAWATEGAG